MNSLRLFIIYNLSLKILVYYYLIFTNFAGLRGISLNLLIRIQLMYPSIKNQVQVILENSMQLIVHNCGLWRNWIMLQLNSTWQQILDASSFSTFSLIIIKLLFRLFFSLSPYWYVNLVIFVVSFVLGLKYTIYDYIREGFVHYIAKPLLGYDYIKWKGEGWNANYYDESQGYLLNRNVLDPWEQPDYNKYLFSSYNKKVLHNKWFISFFITLVYIRLLIINYIYIFIIFQFFLLYFLIFNQYLITASCFSLLFFCSKLYFFSTDFSLTAFYKNIQCIDIINPNTEVIRNTWWNAKVLSQWVARSYFDRFSFYICMLERDEAFEETIISNSLSVADIKTHEYINSYLYAQVTTYKNKEIVKYFLSYTYSTNILYPAIFTNHYKKQLLLKPPHLIQKKNKQANIYSFTITCLFFFILLFLSQLYFSSTLDNVSLATIIPQFYFHFTGNIDSKVKSAQKFRQQLSQQFPEIPSSERTNLKHASVGVIYNVNGKKYFTLFNESTIKKWDIALLWKIWWGEPSSNLKPNEIARGLTTHGLSIEITTDKQEENIIALIHEYTKTNEITKIDNQEEINKLFPKGLFSENNHTLSSQLKTNLPTDIKKDYIKHEKNYLNQDTIAFPFISSSVHLRTIIFSKNKTEKQHMQIGYELKRNSNLIAKWCPKNFDKEVKNRYQELLQLPIKLITYFSNHASNFPYYFSTKHNEPLQNHINAFKAYNDYLEMHISDDASLLKITENFILLHYSMEYQTRTISHDAFLNQHIAYRHFYSSQNPFFVVMKDKPNKLPSSFSERSLTFLEPNIEKPLMKFAEVKKTYEDVM